MRPIVPLILKKKVYSSLHLKLSVSRFDQKLPTGDSRTTQAKPAKTPATAKASRRHSNFENRGQTYSDQKSNRRSGSHEFKLVAKIKYCDSSEFPDAAKFTSTFETCQKT